MRIGYLIAQYPAINHGYLMHEIRFLRECGIQVITASVDLPDRPVEKLQPEERIAAAETFYVKGQSLVRILTAHLATALSRPVAYFRGLSKAMALNGPVLFRLFYFVEAVVIGRWMREKDLDTLHVSFCGHLGMLVSAMFPVRVSLAVYGFGELSGPQGGRLRTVATAMQFVRCISQHSRSIVMLACPPELWGHIVYVPLGIDTRAFLPIPFREDPRPFTITYVGRLAPEKGQSILLTAVAGLLRAGRNVRVQLIGDGPSRAALEEQTVRDGTFAHVVFEGYVEQSRLMASYRETDAFVLTSLYEGIPLVLMEAMAMEIPCVAPHITGIPELIKDGESGLLFTPADSEELSHAIARLMDDRRLAHELAQNGRQRVMELYDLRRNTTRFAEVLRRYFE